MVFNISLPNKGKFCLNDFLATLLSISPLSPNTLSIPLVLLKALNN